MRNFRKILILSVALSSILLACKPEDVKPVGDAFNKIEQINGTWTLSKAVQIDVEAAQKGYPMDVQQMDITRLLPNNPFTDLSITFSSSDMTYSVSKGASFSSWPTSGTWAFDNSDLPSKVFLYTLTDTLSLSISNLSGIVEVPSKITFRETKQKTAGVKLIDAIYYDYSFTKQ